MDAASERHRELRTIIEKLSRKRVAAVSRPCLRVNSPLPEELRAWRVTYHGDLMRRRDVLQQQFASGLIIIAAVTGIILFAAWLEKAWVAIALIGVAAVSVGVRQSWPPLRRYLSRLSRYPVLESQYNETRARITELEHTLEDRPALVARSVQEGRLQVIGTILAARVDPVPMISAVAIRDGGLMVSARSANAAKVPIGARFSLMVEGSDVVLGVVSVQGPGEDETSLVLVCVEEVITEFWERLRSEAGRNPGPPNGVELRRYQIGSLPGLDDIPTNLTRPVARRQRKNADQR